jgi:hypothetical protein
MHIETAIVKTISFTVEALSRGIPLDRELSQLAQVVLQFDASAL